MTYPQATAPRPSLKELVSEVGAGGKYFSFTNIGDSIEGKVLDSKVLQARDAVTKELLYWQDGNPRWNVAITMACPQLRDPQDPEDDGTRTVYVKWWGAQRMSLAQALNQAGVDDVLPGGHFKATFVGLGAAQKGLNPPKLLEFFYAKPSGLAQIAGGSAPGVQNVHPQIQKPVQQQPVQPPVPQGYNTPGQFPTPPAQFGGAPLGAQGAPAQPAPAPVAQPAAPAAAPAPSHTDLAAAFGQIRQGLANGMTPAQIHIMLPHLDMATIEAVASAPVQ